MQNMNIAAVLSGAFGGSAILGLLVFLLFLRKRRRVQPLLTFEVSSRRMAQAQSEMWRINLVPSPARIILPPPPAASIVFQREHDNQAKKARTRSISCSSEGSGYSHLPPGPSSAIRTSISSEKEVIPSPYLVPHLRNGDGLLHPLLSYLSRGEWFEDTRMVGSPLMLVAGPNPLLQPQIGTSAWLGVGDGDRLKSTRLRFRRSSSVGPSVSAHVDDKTDEESFHSCNLLNIQWNQVIGSFIVVFICLYKELLLLLCVYQVGLALHSTLF
ncbi:hypothetical protein DL96DRAFT_1708902 [Flagelloscypha sp. PMI_526]|nr:hypothetical protein DL96DRAFT_1708902 [Flagelloscypha sp. PMI_526]